jgi:putative ABC transport system substrate-binding protein
MLRLNQMTVRGMLDRTKGYARIKNTDLTASSIDLSQHAPGRGLTDIFTRRDERLTHTAGIVPAFDGLKGRADALYVCPSALVAANHVRINTLAVGARMPTIHSFHDFLGDGGLMSYGAKNTDLFRLKGDMVDKILKGAKPADMPFQQPTTFELVINLTAAKALGLTISEAFLLRADMLIE